jgi:hypothetical protein
MESFVRVRLSIFPFRVPGPVRAVGHASPRGLVPLMQFTHPSEYFSGRGIVVLVGRSPLDLRRDGGTLGVFPRPPARRTLKKRGCASLVDFALLQGAFPSRTAKLARRCIPTCVGPSRLARLTTLLRFGASTALETRAATCIGVASPDCAASSAFLRPLTLSSALRPVSLVSCRRRS